MHVYICACFKVYIDVKSYNNTQCPINDEVAASTDEVGCWSGIVLTIDTDCSTDREFYQPLLQIVYAIMM